MEVDVGLKDNQKTYIIGGYASH